jgi:hypothetical protein
MVSGDSLDTCYITQMAYVFDRQIFAIFKKINIFPAIFNEQTKMSRNNG